MKVLIIDRETGMPVKSVIRAGNPAELPSIHSSWRFSFDKHGRKPGAKPFVLVTEATPGVIEGCMIFAIKSSMAIMEFLEVAPHNKGKDKKYLKVAGCLIAYAFGLSLTQIKSDYNGLLFFSVGESEEEDQVKLMAHYSQAYGAVRIDDSKMMIADDDGRLLIYTYLNAQ